MLYFCDYFKPRHADLPLVLLRPLDGSNLFSRSCCWRDRWFPPPFPSRQHPAALSGVTSSMLECTRRLHTGKGSCCSYSKAFYVSIETAKFNRFILLPCTSVYFFIAFSGQCIIKPGKCIVKPVLYFQSDLWVFVGLYAHICSCVCRSIGSQGLVINGCEPNMYVLGLGLQSSKRLASALNLWGISLTLHLEVLIFCIFFKSMSAHVCACLRPFNLLSCRLSAHSLCRSLPTIYQLIPIAPCLLLPLISSKTFAAPYLQSTSSFSLPTCLLHSPISFCMLLCRKSCALCSCS